MIQKEKPLSIEEIKEIVKEITGILEPTKEELKEANAKIKQLEAKNG